MIFKNKDEINPIVIQNDGKPLWYCWLCNKCGCKRLFIEKPDKIPRGWKIIEDDVVMLLCSICANKN